MKFQNCIFINFVTDARTEGRTFKPKAICPFNFSKVGGIKPSWGLKMRVSEGVLSITVITYCSTTLNSLDLETSFQCIWNS